MEVLIILKYTWKRYIHPQTFQSTFTLQRYQELNFVEKLVNLYEVSSRMRIVVTNTNMTGSTTNI